MKANDKLSFASDVASKTGMSVRDVQRSTSRGESIGPENLQRIVRTSLDKGVELDALAKLPEPLTGINGY